MKRVPGPQDTIRRDMLLIFSFGVALRLLLLWLFPAPYGNDSIGRLYFRDSLFLAHWLPLTQALVYLPALLSRSIVPIRLLFAVLGSLAACGFYLLLRRCCTPAFARLGGLLFAANALFVILSLMPYQDVLFLGLFYAALALLFQPQHMLRSRTGGLLYGLACLTRYEAWFALPLLVLWKSRPPATGARVGVVSKNFFAAALFFGWAPGLWLLLSQVHWGEWHGFLFQTADRTFYAWQPHFELGWAVRYAGRMLYWLGLFGSPLLLFALPGMRALWQKPKFRPPVLKLLCAWAALVLIFFFFIIGREFETVNRFAAIPLSLALLLTVIGMQATVANLRQRRDCWARGLTPCGAHVVTALLLAGLTLYAAIPMARLHANPEFRVPYEIARFLDGVLSSGEKALVVAERFHHLQDAAPMAYQRIAAQSQYHREKILCAGLLTRAQRRELLDYVRRQQVRYLVLFTNFQPWLPADVFFTEFVRAEPQRCRPVLRLAQATVYEVTHWPES
ncbi:MAG: hypothetical protein ONB48_18510 [candidate division KSB1 bacterium]|nr:hypothetical protein [candidate division KSB1 bacterium]MDZ7275888.1 hypothetical protein [candidate division KSB1 bacterium]MDZ7287638.1 hypothetical protein [candidate division KSB1 bacterium]MDZ7306800.1 hypothetical protein [candidate division KSB1 bacterium]MDZ7350616.1 hypothetical protein [candidate division KSB1 bacterium]